MKRISRGLLILLLTSCKVMYQPPMQVVPMFSKKGELQATAGNKNVSIAYSASSSLGIVASGYYRNKGLFSRRNDKTRAVNFNGYQRGLSLAFGYYKVLSYGSFEIFGGYGRGYSSISYDVMDADIRQEGGNAYYNLFSIQPNLIIGSKYAKFGFSNRLSVVNFNRFNDARHTVLDPETVAFLEPAITFRFKYGPASLKTQIQASWPLAKPTNGFGDYDPYNDILLVTGCLEIHFGELFNRN